MAEMIAFYGGDSQTGVTMITQSVGEQLTGKGFRVLLLAAGTEPGDDYIPGKGVSSIDDLRPYLLEGQLTAAEAEQSIVCCRKLDILPAVRSYHSMKMYQENTLELLYECFKEKYDYILVDGGSSVTEPLTLSALRHCHTLFFIVTQQQKVLRRLAFRKSQLIQLTVPIFYVVNKYHDEKYFHSLQQLALQLQCEEDKLFKVPYVPYGWQAEMEQETLLQYRTFAAGVSAISRKISHKEAERKKISRFDWQRRMRRKRFGRN